MLICNISENLFNEGKGRLWICHLSHDFIDTSPQAKVTDNSKSLVALNNIKYTNNIRMPLLTYLTANLWNLFVPDFMFHCFCAEVIQKLGLAGFNKLNSSLYISSTSCVAAIFI